MNVQLTDDQQFALNQFTAWFRDRDSQFFHIDGNAGSGKTTLIKVIHDMLINDGNHCRIAAFTGKAVSVLRKKGLDTACTIHHLIYRPFDPDEEKREELTQKLHETEDPEERLLIHSQLDELQPIRYNSLNPSAFQQRDADDEPPPDLIIIDETSMVNRYMMDDLASFNIPVLLVGDWFQLPPVKAQTHQIPIDVSLEQVTRQAEDSPILRMATHLRRSGGLIDCGPDACVVSCKPTNWMSEFDQLLCGRNRTRIKLNDNARVKLLQAQDPLPVVGDRMICLRNDSGGYFYNGSLWNVTDVTFVSGNDCLLVKLLPNIGEPGFEPIECSMHRKSFLPDAHYSIKRFDYANAMTVHKSQGSEWNSVCVIDESSAWHDDENGNRLESTRWLYTAITRAKERLVVVR